MRAPFTVELVAALRGRVGLRGIIEIKARCLFGGYNQSCLARREISLARRGFELGTSRAKRANFAGIAMLISIEGIYRDGQIVLKEPPSEVQTETPVIVIFIDARKVDLQAQGIGASQAGELRAALATFEDWNEPEMDVYDDYHAPESTS